MNTKRSPAYFKTRDIIRSCKNILHWETAKICLENYEKKFKKEYGLNEELKQKQQLFI